MSCGTEGAKPKIDKGNLSKELYRTLFVQAADGIFIADASGHYIEVNPRGCEMLGYTREEILELSMSDLVLPGDDQQELDELLAKGSKRDGRGPEIGRAHV